MEEKDAENKETKSENNEKSKESQPEPTYLELLEAKKRELLEIEERLDKKKKEWTKEQEAAMMSGRSYATKPAKKEETNEEYSERIRRGEI